MTYLWIIKLVLNRFSNNSTFSDFPSKVGIVVVRTFSSLQSLLMLLWKLEELLLLTNCCRANSSDLLQLSQGFSSCEISTHFWSGPFFVFRRYSRGAIGSPFFNSSHHLRSLLWVWVFGMTGLRDVGSHSRMRVILGTILIWFSVFHFFVREFFQIGSGVSPYLWVQGNIFQFRQSTQNSGVSPVELLGQFFSDSAFNLFTNLFHLFLVSSKNGCVSWLAVHRKSLLCFLCNGCQLSFVSPCSMLPSFERENATQLWRLIFI